MGTQIPQTVTDANGIAYYSTTVPQGKPNGSYLVNIQATAAGFSASNLSGQEINVSHVAGMPTVTVISPNGGESWSIGSNQTIKVSSNGGVSRYVFEYSMDGGSVWAPIPYNNFVSNSNTASTQWRIITKSS